MQVQETKEKELESKKQQFQVIGVRLVSFLLKCRERLQVSIPSRCDSYSAARAIFLLLQSRLQRSRIDDGPFLRQRGLLMLDSCLVPCPFVVAAVTFKLPSNARSQHRPILTSTLVDLGLLPPSKTPPTTRAHVRNALSASSRVLACTYQQFICCHSRKADGRMEHGFLERRFRLSPKKAPAARFMTQRAAQKHQRVRSAGVRERVWSDTGYLLAEAATALSAGKRGANHVAE